MSAIRAGAAVRHKASGKLGRTFRNTLRGYVWVQWDGDRDRQTVRQSEVSLVANQYETAKAWETAKQ